MATGHLRRNGRLLALLGVVAAAGSCALGSAAPISPAEVPKARLALLRRSHVWTPTKVASMNIRTGPTGPGAFKPGQTVRCDYVDEKLEGGTPKFRCAISKDDQVKVKYGEGNGEVFGEVAASRLLWALGFPADAQYPVRVICTGCSDDPWTKRERANGESTFEFAAIERKYPATEMTPDDKTGWAWPELELVDEEAGGAPRAHRDALKLLAVLIQHTDSKPEQQRLVCGDGEEPASDGACRRPFMMINDLGLTFGRANNLNRNERGSTNFKAWTEVAVWKDPARCVGYLEKSFTGTLEHPVISEAGRKFLADLIGQLTDAQLRELFEVSRVARRAVEVDGVQQRASADEWVAAFKDKRAQIVNHRCG